MRGPSATPALLSLPTEAEFGQFCRNNQIPPQLRQNLWDFLSELVSISNQYFPLNDTTPQQSKALPKALRHSQKLRQAISEMSPTKREVLMRKFGRLVIDRTTLDWRGKKGSPASYAGKIRPPDGPDFDESVRRAILSRSADQVLFLILETLDAAALEISSQILEPRPRTDRRIWMIANFIRHYRRLGRKPSSTPDGPFEIFVSRLLSLVGECRKSGSLSDAIRSAKKYGKRFPKLETKRG